MKSCFGAIRPVPLHRGHSRASAGRSVIRASVPGLRSERHSAGMRERAGQPSEDAEVGVKLDAIQSTRRTLFVNRVSLG